MHDWASHDSANPKGFARVIQHAKKTLMVMEPWSEVSCLLSPAARICGTYVNIYAWLTSN